MIIHMYSAGMDEEGRVVIGRPGDAIEVPTGHRSCGAPIGYPCTCPNCVAGTGPAFGFRSGGVPFAGSGGYRGAGRGEDRSGYDAYRSDSYRSDGYRSDAHAPERQGSERQASERQGSERQGERQGSERHGADRHRGAEGHGRDGGARPGSHADSHAQRDRRS